MNNWLVGSAMSRHDFQKQLAVLFQLVFADAADLRELMQVARLARGDLHERRIMKDHVGRHRLPARQLQACFAQRLPQHFIFRREADLAARCFWLFGSPLALRFDTKSYALLALENWAAGRREI